LLRYMRSGIDLRKRELTQRGAAAKSALKKSGV
jgi:hypothetical protein